MRAGKLRHRVTVLTATETYDEFGAPVRSWRGGPLSNRWAWIRPLRGRELWQAQQVQSDVTHRVVMRHDPDIKPKDKLRHRGRELEISSIIDVDELGHSMELLCVERVT